MHGKVETKGQRGKQHGRDLQELTMVDGRTDVELHDETIVDSGRNKCRQVELKEHSEEDRQEQRRVDQEERLDLRKVSSSLVSQSCTCHELSASQSSGGPIGDAHTLNESQNHDGKPDPDISTGGKGTQVMLSKGRPVNNRRIVSPCITERLTVLVMNCPLSLPTAFL